MSFQNFLNDKFSTIGAITSPLAGGVSSAQMRQPLVAANLQSQVARPEVGAGADALAQFALQREEGADLVNFMRRLYESNQPTWEDYARQFAMQVGSQAVGAMLPF